MSGHCRWVLGSFCRKWPEVRGGTGCPCHEAEGLAGGGGWPALCLERVSTPLGLRGMEEAGLLGTVWE